MGEPVERGDGREILPVAAGLELRVGLAKVVAEKSGVAPHTARQQPAAQRAVREHGETAPPSVRQDAGLDRPLEQVVR